MKKHVLIASMIAGLGVAPVAAFAADSSSPDSGASTRMQGSPNANGARQGRSESGSETNAPAASGNNGAASAKATGESGDKNR